MRTLTEVLLTQLTARDREGGIIYKYPPKMFEPMLPGNPGWGHRWGPARGRCEAEIGEIPRSEQRSEISERAREQGNKTEQRQAGRKRRTRKRGRACNSGWTCSNPGTFVYVRLCYDISVQHQTQPRTTNSSNRQQHRPASITSKARVALTKDIFRFGTRRRTQRDREIKTGL